jgi:multiple sugar transport system substrate-binding protein
MEAKFMKKLFAVFMLLLPVLLFAGGGGQGARTGAKQRELNIWLWDTTSPNRISMYQAFTEKTGIKVNLFAVLAKDMVMKLQTTLAANGEMPDVAWCEQTYRGKLLSLDIWEDMTAAPYNVDRKLVLDYLLPLETSEEGNWVGPECPSVAGMAYKRDLTKQYFGTDDPAKLEAMFPTWAEFKRAAQDVQRKSGGKVFMMSSLGFVLQVMKGQTAEPFIIGNKLNLEKSMQPILEELIDFKRNNVTDVIQYDTPEEGASYAANDHIFYPCANWSLKYTIRPNDKNGQGRWGFMLPPNGPFPLGGTVQAVPKKAQNKMEAAEYIKELFLSEFGAVQMRDWTGNFIPYKPIYQQANFYSEVDEWFAGQDVQQVIAQKVLPNIKTVRPPSRYDQDIADEFNLAIMTINSGANVTAARLISQIKDNLINKNPELQR